MKFIIVFLTFIAIALSLTCDLCGTRDCCKPTACSLGCRSRGRAGGYCEYASRENRCICYCYRSKDKEGGLSDRAEDMPYHVNYLPIFFNDFGKQLNITIEDQQRSIEMAIKRVVMKNKYHKFCQ